MPSRYSPVAKHSPAASPATRMPSPNSLDTPASPASGTMCAEYSTSRPPRSSGATAGWALNASISSYAGTRASVSDAIWTMTPRDRLSWLVYRNAPPFTPPVIAPTYSYVTPSSPVSANRSSIASRPKATTSLTPSDTSSGFSSPRSPARLARNALTPSAATTTAASTSPSGRLVRTPTTRPAPSLSRSSTTVAVSRVAPASTAWSASQRSNRGRSSVNPLYGSWSQLAVRKSTASADSGDVNATTRRVRWRSTGAQRQNSGTSASSTWGA